MSLWSYSNYWLGFSVRMRSRNSEATVGINLHIYPSPILNESRIQRETRSSFATGCFSRVEVAGVWQQGLARSEQWMEGVWIRRFGNETSGSTLAKVKKSIGMGLALVAFYRKKNISVINCHSVAALPVCRLLATLTGASLIYDTHELETETLVESRYKKRLYKTVEAALIRGTDHTFVVGEEIADWYRQRYPGINLGTLYNFPSAFDDRAEVTDKYFHKYFDLPSQDVVFLYSGVIAPGRGIDTLLEAFTTVPRHWVLVFMGYGPGVATVKEATTKNPRSRYHPPVPPEEVLAHTKHADIGLSLIQPGACLSYELSAPNKLFQYAYCGLIPVVSDIPEQRRFVDTHNWGVVVPDLSAVGVRVGCESALLQLAEERQTPQTAVAWEQYDPVIAACHEQLLRTSGRT